MEDENRRFKQLVADLSLDREALKVVIGKTAGACRSERDIAFVSAGFHPSERRTCKLLGVEMIAVEGAYDCSILMND